MIFAVTIYSKVGVRRNGRRECAVDGMLNGESSIDWAGEKRRTMSARVSGSWGRCLQFEEVARLRRELVALE